MPATLGGGRGRPRVERVRGADQPADDRALLGREVLGGFAEVGLGRGLDAVASTAEVDRVQVEFQHIILGVLLIDLDRHGDLFELPGEGPFLGQIGVLGVLLGDGGTALGDLATTEVHPDRAGDPLRGDAGLAVEVLVLGGQHRVLGVHRHLRERDVRPVDRSDLGDFGPAVGVGDDRRLFGGVHRCRQRHLCEGQDERHQGCDHQHAGQQPEQDQPAQPPWTVSPEHRTVLALTLPDRGRGRAATRTPGRGVADLIKGVTRSRGGHVIRARAAHVGGGVAGALADADAFHRGAVRRVVAAVAHPTPAVGTTIGRARTGGTGMVPADRGTAHVRTCVVIVARVHVPIVGWPH